jgi:threonine/homoserine/homoserine lactone efflux protein
MKCADVAYLLYLGLSGIFSHAGPLSMNPSKQKQSSGYKVFFKALLKSCLTLRLFYIAWRCCPNLLIYQTPSSLC